jgi:hypothetical protein
LLVVFVSLYALGPKFNVWAQESCTRVHISFRASQATTLSGKLGVRYEDSRTVGFVDFHIEETTIAGGDEVRIGAFNIIDMESFKSIFNDDEVNIDGDGAFRMRKTDCADTLPTDDGRLNLDDPASLAVIYANTRTKGYDVYHIDPATGSGRLLIRASRALIDAARSTATAPHGVNTLIAGEETISLWALTSGECQRNAFYADGKPDIFIFECER